MSLLEKCPRYSEPCENYDPRMDAIQTTYPVSVALVIRCRFWTACIRHLGAESQGFCKPDVDFDREKDEKDPEI